MTELISPTFNLVVLIAILAYYLKGPIRDFVSNRHVTVRQELERVSELLRQANDQNIEFSAKLKAIDAELAAMREQVIQDAQAAKQRVIADAQKHSSTIVSDARAAAEGLYADLKGRLQSELGAHIIERAEKILRERLTDADRASIRKEFSNQMENVR